MGAKVWAAWSREDAPMPKWFRNLKRAFRREWARQSCERYGHDWSPLELVRETESGVKFWSTHCRRPWCTRYLVGDAAEMEAALES